MALGLLRQAGFPHLLNLRGGVARLGARGGPDDADVLTLQSVRDVPTRRAASTITAPAAA